MTDRVLRLRDDGEQVAELPVIASSGAADAGKVPVLGSEGTIDASMIPARAGDAYYVHTQGVPSATWVVIHGLGKYPSVTLRDSAGDVVEADVHYDSLNQLTVTASAAFSGEALCN